jgi:predicted Zn finger-like uncharacterized protein
MNVTCPQCATIFRVDPAKVPERGVRARCSVCAGLIAVRRPPVAAPASPKPPAAVIAPEPPVVRAVAAPAVVTPSPEPAPVAAPAPTPPPQAPAPMVHPPAAPIVPPPIAAPVTPPAVMETAPFAMPPMPEPVAMPSSPPSVPFSALPPEPAPPVTPPRTTGPGPSAGFTNPFLQQDPGTRARRLARALISDLVVYHPEKRQRGLADGNLKELFAEEIRKSWEEYSEQVGEEIASSTPFFTEALNEILSEGRQLFG